LHPAFLSLLNRWDSYIDWSDNLFSVYRRQSKSIGESGVLKDGEIDRSRLEQYSMLRNKFSVHGPFTFDRDYYGNSINLGVKSNRNFEIMAKVFEVADYLDAEHVVLHGDRAETDHGEALLNVIANFKQLSKMAADYNITVLIENLHKELQHDRIGILPQEILQVIQAVDEENLKFCFDIGHGTLSAKQYGFDILDFITLLSPYLVHMHFHDNMGIPEVVDQNFGDQHLALGQGKVEVSRILEAVGKLKVKNAVLELRPAAGRRDALKSVATLKALQRKMALH
jgi:sugar phosphate isomerase/epimerase